MEEGRAGSGEPADQRHRVAGLARDRVEVAALEPDGPAVQDVHRGDDCNSYVIVLPC